MERDLATKAPRTQGGTESHSGQRAGEAPFALQMQAAADPGAWWPRDAPAWRGWHHANGARPRFTGNH